VGVGAVVLSGGKVLLVRRRHPPLAGEWSLPGGAVELGETLEQALAREVLEETGLQVSIGPVVEVLDRITPDAGGRIEYHYVLVDYLCGPVGGELAAGSDVDDVRFADPADLAAYQLTAAALHVIARAVAMAREAAGSAASQRS
jgi:mutator protein MutT